MVPTRILICIFALGVGIKSSFAQESSSVPKTSSEIHNQTQAQNQAQAQEPPVPSPSKDESLKLKIEPQGDLRYRLAQSKEDVDETRTFHQLRARLGVKAQVEEDLSLIFRLATATSAISSNLTLGDSKDPGMPRRSFGLDLAYTEFKWGGSGKLWAGRTANPFWAPAKNQLIYDGDLAFEGLALKWEPKWENDHSLFMNFGAFMVNESYERPYDTADLGIAGAQIGYSWGGFTVHLAHQAFINIQDRNITGVEKDAKTDVYQGTSYNVYRGNTVYVNDPLLAPVDRKYFFSNQYVVGNLGLEYKLKAFSGEFLFFADAIQNSKVSTQANGYEAGLGLKFGNTSLQIAQVVKEADATVGAFSDSDTNGGGTDTSGQRVIVGYQLSKKSQISLNSFRAKRGVATVTRDYSLTQLDLSASF